MRLEWATLALEDRERIFDYIERHNPRVAVTIDARIASQVERLVAFPESGRPGCIEGTRELVIDHNTPYIAAYRILNDVVRVLRVLHGSQQWPDEALN